MILKKIPLGCLMLVFTMSTEFAFAQSDDCGKPGTLIGKVNDKKVELKTRIFPDGSIAVKAPLAVNPDGGPGSYTVGNHGFTYIANGLARWRNGKREKCDSDCTTSFKAAESAGFATGTDEFCVFAMEVEPLNPKLSKQSCKKGYIIGNGKGRPVLGEMLDTVTGGKIQAYASTTSLQHLVNGKTVHLNSETLPIAVTPSIDLLGKVVWVRNGNAGSVFAMIGDEGPAFGEGSIALHQLLRQGSVKPQKLGPIPANKRCQLSETVLLPPFQSFPNGGETDRCRKDYVAKTASDIRAYWGFDKLLDFVILGKAEFQRKDNAIQSEVTGDSIKALAEQAGYSQEKIDHMISCLGK